jgi:hypothetical protein
MSLDPDSYLPLRSIVTSQNLQQIEDLAPTVGAASALPNRYRGVLGSRWYAAVRDLEFQSQRKQPDPRHRSNRV